MDMEQEGLIDAWIFARGGSTGLLGKNIKALGGMPLIAHSIRVAQASARIDRIFVSTDCPAIAEVAREHGAEVPFLRPAELASNSAPERLAWRHAIEWSRESGLAPMRVMVSLPVTSPLRTVAEVDRGIGDFLEGAWDTVLAISQSERHPAFNMVYLDSDGAAALAMPTPNRIARRQDCPTLYNIATAFFITDPEFVLQTDSFWDGSVGSVIIPAEHAVDIDTELDFVFAEFLYEREGRECE
jgi:N-acylneuraminate cytidylyltransferase